MAHWGGKDTGKKVSVHAHLNRQTQRDCVCMYRFYINSMFACVCIFNYYVYFYIDIQPDQKQRTSSFCFLFWAIRFQWNLIYIPFKGFIKSVLFLEDCSWKLTSASTTSRYKAIFSQTAIMFLKEKGKYFIFSLEIINRLKVKQTFAWQISRLGGDEPPSKWPSFEHAILSSS